MTTADEARATYVDGYDVEHPWSLQSTDALSRAWAKARDELYAIVNDATMPHAEKALTILTHYARLPRQAKEGLNARNWIDQADIYSRLAACR